MTMQFVAVDGELHIKYDEQICTKCILPRSFPGLSFDAHGVCSYCTDSQEQIDTRKQAITEGVKAALSTASADRSYDGLALYSGGKDSSLALAAAQRDFGLRILAFTLDNSFLSKTTGENMRHVLDNLGIDHVVFRPPRRVMRPIYQISMSLEFGSDTTKYSTGGCGSCISMVLATAMRFAAAHNIPLLVGGWTPGQLTTSPLVPVSFLRDIVDRHFDPLTAASTDLGDQLATWRDSTRVAPVGLVNPLYVTQYSEEAAVSELGTIGWKAPTDTDSCSTNCRLNGLLIIDHIKKYGFHPYVYELAHHVRLNALSRAEALEKVSNIGVHPATLDKLAKELGVNGLLSGDQEGTSNA